MKRSLLPGILLCCAPLPSLTQKGTEGLVQGLIQAHDPFNASDHPAVDCDRISCDEGHSRSEEKTIYPGSADYSSMTVFVDGQIGLIFEKDFHAENLFVSFGLERLTDGEDHRKDPDIHEKL